jgi:glycerate dehydrogenase
MKIVFLDAHTINPGDLSWESLQRLGELQVFDRTPESGVAARARDADVLLTMRTPVTAETMLKMIVNPPLRSDAFLSRKRVPEASVV